MHEGQRSSRSAAIRGIRRRLILRKRLKRRFIDREATLGIIGMGYVGLPLMLACTRVGFKVLGFDIDGPKVGALNHGDSPLKHVGDDRCAAAHAQGRFEATADFPPPQEADAVLICVPTPLGRHHEPDLSYVEETARSIAARLRPGQLIVLESTTWPGTTREVVKPILEATGLESGEDFFLAYARSARTPATSTSTTAHPEGGRRRRRGRARPGLRALRSLRDPHRPRLLADAAEAVEADREHLPRRQHRARRTSSRWSTTPWASTSWR